MPVDRDVEAVLRACSAPGPPPNKAMTQMPTGSKSATADNASDDMPLLPSHSGQDVLVTRSALHISVISGEPASIEEGL